LTPEQIEAKKKEDYTKRSIRIHEKEKEKKQKERDNILSKYVPLHQDIFTLHSSFFSDQFLAIEKSGDPISLLKEESSGIYSLDLLTSEFCRLVKLYLFH
jgi:hypothetical protein